MKSLVTVLVKALMVVLVGCSQPSDHDVIIIGTSPDYPPFSYMKDGQLKGYEVDLAHALGQHLNKEIQIKQIDFSSLIPALKSGQIDLILSSVSQTPEREKAVDFSEPYYHPQLAVIANRPPQDITWEHQNVGVQLGSVMEQFLRERNLPSLTITRFNKNNEIVQDLKAGRLDYVLIEGIQAHAFTKMNPELFFKLLPKHKPSHGYSVVLPKNSSLTPLVNSALKTLKKQGKLEDLRKKWCEKCL